jgi:hypothetical protein
MYSGNTDEIYFALARSSRCFLCFSVVQPKHHLVDGDPCNPLVDDACIPRDMTFSFMRSIRISSTDFSTALRSLDIHTCNKINQVGEQEIKVIK